MWLQAAANGALVGMSLSWLILFGRVWAYGTVPFAESSRVLLGGEIVICALSFMVGILAFCRLLIAESRK